jgi:hypothetical protein
MTGRRGKFNQEMAAIANHGSPLNPLIAITPAVFIPNDDIFLKINFSKWKASRFIARVKTGLLQVIL